MLNWRTLLLFICVGGLSIVLPTQVLQIKALIGKPPIQLSDPQLTQRARSITVKVMSGHLLGSGILMYKRDSVYTVLTNDHVLKAGNPPYQIWTSDGKLYDATKVSPANSLQGNDLGILQFVAPDTDYPVAKLGTTPTAETYVVAAGFPFSAQGFKDGGFVKRTGKVEWVLDKALEGGYKIGYTNEVEKGMSGGPLLNSAGELVGINGVHAHPVWGAPYVFQDGSEPSESEREKMSGYSWGIPVATFEPLVSSAATANEPQ